RKEARYGSACRSRNREYRSAGDGDESLAGAGVLMRPRLFDITTSETGVNPRAGSRSLTALVGAVVRVDRLGVIERGNLVVGQVLVRAGVQPGAALVVEVDEDLGDLHEHHAHAAQDQH